MAGDEPAYRDIVNGSKGADVEQLQRFLDSVGVSPEPVDGVWGTSAASAWNAWRRAQRMPLSTTVPLGEIVFVPGLPRMIAATDTLVLGRVVAGSEQMASLLRPSPSLAIVVPTDSSLGLAPGINVDVEIGSQQIATQEQEVTVLAKVGPEAVVDGIRPGDTVQLPGTPAASNTTATSNP